MSDLPIQPESLALRMLGEWKALLDEGGWVFVCLLVLAFGIAYSLLLIAGAMRLSATPIVDGASWRAMLKGDTKGPAWGLLLNRLSEDTESRFEQIRHDLFDPAERRFPLAFTLIGAAPLVGLLGTVVGMLKTFGGMASSSAAAPIDVISEGISEALITTQTGLIIGVPTLILASWMKARFNTMLIGFERLQIKLLREIDNSISEKPLAVAND